MTIQKAANAIVGAIERVPVLVLVAQQFLENQCGQFLVFIRAGDVRILDLASHILFFIGQEQEDIAIAGNERFTLESLQ